MPQIKKLKLTVDDQVQLASPSGGQDGSSPLNIPPLDSPNFPVELWDEIGKILSEDVVESTARDLLNLMLSCRKLCPIFRRRLYIFNGRMLEKPSTAFIDRWLAEPGTEPKIDWRERSAMLWAAQNGSMGTARAVMEITPDLCQADHVGIAIRHQQYELAWMLLKWQKIEAEVSVTGPLKIGQLPSYQARLPGISSYQGPPSSEMLSVLIKHGLDVNQTSGSRTLLMYALRHLKWSKDTIGVVKDMVPLIRDINQQLPDGFPGDDDTALMYWLRSPNGGERLGEALCLEVTGLLLDHGASLTSRNWRGDTPLHIATAECYPSVVKVLINRGADVSASNNNGETPLHMTGDHIYSVAGLYSGDRPQLIRATVQKIIMLIDANADPESLSDNGTIALRPQYEAWECHDSFEKIVEIYTSSAQKRGGPVNVIDFLHRRPYLLRDCVDSMYWKRDEDNKGKPDFEFLLGYGLNIDEHDHMDENLLDMALQRGHRLPATEEYQWLFMYLLGQGANINNRNQIGQTVLDRTEDVSKRDFLIRYGALLGSELDEAFGN
ncbi:unnamed protein product [Clonostachys rosea]|uniref:F-box domain-containing protein n=1 Tax=Bionectria ochroleuca TaxID=29856 RepID=A0ABY6UAG9_BIOOC|nr:unnamed protein product [Clonostachys rosea]